VEGRQSCTRSHLIKRMWIGSCNKITHSTIFLNLVCLFILLIRLKWKIHLNTHLQISNSHLNNKLIEQNLPFNNNSTPLKSRLAYNNMINFSTKDQALWVRSAEKHFKKLRHLIINNRLQLGSKFYKKRIIITFSKKIPTELPLRTWTKEMTLWKQTIKEALDLANHCLMIKQ